MPNTNIFGSGSSYEATSYGGINVEYKDDTANITIKYFKTSEQYQRTEERETKATLQLFSLKQLQRESFFKEQFDETTTFNYLHQWTMSRKSNQLVVYAGYDELAFMFTSNSDNLVDDLMKLIGRHTYQSVPFFEEMVFALIAQKEWNISIDQLRNMPNMSGEKLAYFSRNPRQVSKLIEKGMALAQLVIIDFEKLKKIVGSAYEIDQILQFVTINQIFGVDHMPPPILPMISKQQRPDNYKFMGSFGGGSSGDFSYEHGLNNDLTITYKKNTKCEYSSGQLKEVYFAQFNQIVNQANVIRYLHRWVKIPVQSKEENQEKKTKAIYYSPDTHTIINEAYDDSFPIEELKKNHNHILIYVPYYQEVMKEEHLVKLGSSFEKLRALSGMTEAKIQALTDRYYDTEKLLKLGLSMEDLARVDESRLISVMENFNTVQKALEFVDVRELLGLNTVNPTLGLLTSQNYAPNLFRTSSTSSALHVGEELPHEHAWPCTLL